jgi:hypothetical protein
MENNSSGNETQKREFMKLEKKGVPQWSVVDPAPSAQSLHHLVSVTSEPQATIHRVPYEKKELLP